MMSSELVGLTFPMLGVTQVTWGMGAPVAWQMSLMLSARVRKRVLGVSQGGSGEMVITGAAVRGGGGGEGERERVKENTYSLDVKFTCM